MASWPGLCGLAVVPNVFAESCRCRLVPSWRAGGPLKHLCKSAGGPLVGQRRKAVNLEFPQVTRISLYCGTKEKGRLRIQAAGFENRLLDLPTDVSSFRDYIRRANLGNADAGCRRHDPQASIYRSARDFIRSSAVFAVCLTSTSNKPGRLCSHWFFFSTTRRWALCQRWAC